MDALAPKETMRGEGPGQRNGYYKSITSWREEWREWPERVKKIDKYRTRVSSQQATPNDGAPR
jgi:hypothetical protein